MSRLDFWNCAQLVAGSAMFLACLFGPMAVVIAILPVWGYVYGRASEVRASEGGRHEQQER